VNAIRGLALLAFCAWCSGSALAQQPDPRIADEIEEALLRLADMGVLQGGDGRPLVIERQPRVRYELGAVVGIEDGLDALPVVAITPGGHAERMGLKVGDRIVSINGIVMARSADPGADFAQSVSRAQGKVALTIRRDDREILINGIAEAIEVPGFRLSISQPLRQRRAPPREE